MDCIPHFCMSSGPLLPTAAAKIQTLVLRMVLVDLGCQFAGYVEQGQKLFP